jgi:hypothetical protein
MLYACFARFPPLPRSTLDDNGREQLHVSRLAMDLVAGNDQVDNRQILRDLLLSNGFELIEVDAMQWGQC